MTKLFTMPGTCSLAPNIAIAWVGAPIEIENLAYGDHKKEAYLQINPKGQVPALQFDDGDVLTEAAAIMSYIGAAYGTANFAQDTKLGRKEAEALSYMTSGVHATYGPHFSASSFVEKNDAQEALKSKTYEKLKTQYAALEKTLSESGDYYLGEKSFADAYLYVLNRWIEQTPISLSDYPALSAHRKMMEDDEGVRIALSRQDMKLIG